MTMTRTSSWQLPVCGPLALIAFLVVTCSTMMQHQVGAWSSSNSPPNRLQSVELTMLRTGFSPAAENVNPRNNKSCLCPHDDDQELMIQLNGGHEESSQKSEEELSLDRREAASAMLGGLWAAGSLPTALLFGQPKSAFAYGEDAKMEMPDIIGGMSDRVNKQCLVESLGTRQCLVYMDDEANLLYKGADVQVLLDRIESASKALAIIPSLVENRKWTAVTGQLTGPMGQLSFTMTALAKLSSDPAQSEVLAKQVKTDVFAIGSAASNKSETAALKAHEAATRDLVLFVKSL